MGKLPYVRAKTQKTWPENCVTPRMQCHMRACGKRLPPRDDDNRNLLKETKNTERTCDQGLLSCLSETMPIET